MPSDLALAIANEEGFNKPGSIPARANNPGDLKLGNVGNGTINGITIFSSASDGWDALENQLTAIANGGSSYYSPDMSIAEIGQVYAGGDPTWAVNVASYLGVSPDTPFANVYGGGGGVVNAVLQDLGIVNSSAESDSWLSSLLPSTPMGYALWGVGIAVGLAVLVD